MRVFTRSLANITKQIYIHPANAISFSKQDNGLKIGHFTNSSFTKENFVPNPQFLPKLQDLIGHKIYDDFTFLMEASVNANSFMPIYDMRNVPRYGRIPEIDNVYGYLQVDELGKMIGQTYQANDMYLLFNADGLITLSDFLLEEVRKL